MAAKIISEIDSYDTRFHFKVGLFFITILLIIFFIFKNINNNETIPLLKIKSDGIFGKKTLFIEPGFGDFYNKSNEQYIFNQTQDSYSVDMFLRYLNDLNE